MKAVLLAGVALASLGAFAAPAHADPCSTVLCMVGLAMNPASIDSNCAGDIAKYFSLRVYVAHHAYDPGATANLRANYMSLCPAPTTVPFQQVVTATFGPVYDRPGSL